MGAAVGCCWRRGGDVFANHKFTASARGRKEGRPGSSDSSTAPGSGQRIRDRRSSGLRQDSAATRSGLRTKARRPVGWPPSGPAQIWRSGRPARAATPTGAAGPRGPLRTDRHQATGGQPNTHRPTRSVLALAFLATILAGLVGRPRPRPRPPARRPDRFTERRLAHGLERGGPAGASACRHEPRQAPRLAPRRRERDAARAIRPAAVPAAAAGPLCRPTAVSPHFAIGQPAGLARSAGHAAGRAWGSWPGRPSTGPTRPGGRPTRPGRRSDTQWLAATSAGTSGSTSRASRSWPHPLDWLVRAQAERLGQALPGRAPVLAYDSRGDATSWPPWPTTGPRQRR